jgi:hypothetical protein
MPSDTFADNLEKGRKGEQEFARLLREQGIFVSDRHNVCRDRDQHGPQIVCDVTGYTLPDLFVAYGGRSAWLEAKTYAKPDLFRKTGKHRHGIDLRLYYHYKEVEVLTGLPVWLGIWEERGPNGEIDTPLVEQLSVLGYNDRENFAPANWLTGKEMVFWDRDQLQVGVGAIVESLTEPLPTIRHSDPFPANTVQAALGRFFRGLSA